MSSVEKKLLCFKINQKNIVLLSHKLTIYNIDNQYYIV